MSQNKRQPTVDELNSSCFHHEDKGCVVVWFGYFRTNKKPIKNTIDEVNKVNRASLRRGKCKTHNVKICFCCWEVGTHYNQLSEGYNPPG